jgi:hypothetical protein
VDALDVDYHVYPSCDYESVWNTVVVPAATGEYCGYLRWLEEEMPDEVGVVEEEEEEVVVVEEDDGVTSGGGNEIDRLAEQFIARCPCQLIAGEAGVVRPASGDDRQEPLNPPSSSSSGLLIDAFFFF